MSLMRKRKNSFHLVDKDNKILEEAGVGLNGAVLVTEAMMLVVEVR